MMPQGESLQRLWTGVAGALLSAGYLHYSLTEMSRGTLERPGPAVFPIVVGALGILVCLLTCWDAVREGSADPTSDGYLASGEGKAARDGEHADNPVVPEADLGEDSRSGARSPGMIRVYMLVAVILGYILMLPVLGQYIAAAGFGVLTVKAFGHYSWIRAAIYGVALSLGINLFFIELLGVRMPSGLMGV